MNWSLVCILALVRPMEMDEQHRYVGRGDSGYSRRLSERLWAQTAQLVFRLECESLHPDEVEVTWDGKIFGGPLPPDLRMLPADVAIVASLDRKPLGHFGRCLGEKLARTCGEERHNIVDSHLGPAEYSGGTLGLRQGRCPQRPKATSATL